MAAKVKVDAKAVRELLKSPEVQADLERRAKAIAEAAGPGFVVASRQGPNRVHVEVQTDTFEAIRAEAEKRALTRAIDAGRT